MSFFYSVSLHKKTLELTAVVVLANLFKHNTLITSLRVIYKYKNVSFCSYKLYREGLVTKKVLDTLCELLELTEKVVLANLIQKERSRYVTSSDFTKSKR